MYISIILQYKEHLSKLESEIDALGNDIKSIPDIGKKIAATIISEIGEIDRFTDPKKLVAFAGVVRHALYMAVRCAIRDCRKSKTSDEIIPRNKKLREFYDKKREEGKPFKVAVIACVNKLLHCGNVSLIISSSNSPIFPLKKSCFSASKIHDYLT